VLSRRYSLHDVEDVEAFCARVLDERLKRYGGVLRPDMYEDALAYLVVEAWKLSGKWDPAKGIPSFSTFAYRRLRFAVVNWYRITLGDSRFHKGRRAALNATLSLDADAASGTELVELVAGSAGDPADDRSPISLGSSMKQVAAELGIAPKSVSELMDELRREILSLVAAGRESNMECGNPPIPHLRE
jgi:DNA-directed RNA polymerase specialized sigma24 family protein